MNSSIEEQNRMLGFLALYETPSQDGYLGAVLITDMQGTPQEFRCTYPVKPTPIQKSLYGDTLEPHIGVNLCGIPLMESIKSKPLLIIVRREVLLNVRTACPYPIIFIRRAGEVIDIETVDSPKTKLTKERLESSTGKFQPIVFSPHPDFEDDISSTRKNLEEIFAHLDPLEPFERIQKAIEVLAKQDSKFG